MRTARGTAAVLTLRFLHAIDLELARLMERIAEVCGFPLVWGGQKFFLFGLMPMGDAFAVWSLVAPERSGM